MMKKTLLVFTILAVLMTTTPVSAASNVPVGERIFLPGYAYGSTTTYPAGVPFHIYHGWRNQGGEIDPVFLPRTSFKLWIDDVLIKETYIDRGVMWDDTLKANVQKKIYYYNFPTGMAGLHKFTGRWYCQCADRSTTCKDPKEIIEAQEWTIYIDFISTP